MAHSKNIIIKCPACGERFEAEREAESTFLSCPECDIQVKISGTEERRSRAPRRMAPAGSAIPSKRYQERVQFSDLSSASVPIDLESARKRAQQKEEEMELIIDDDEEGLSDQKEPPKVSKDPEPKQPVLTGIERRAAKLEERAAKLEERAAKLNRLKEDREVAAEALNKAEASKEKTEASEPSNDGKAKKDSPDKKGGAVDEKASMEKVEVRSSGERRRLRRAPKAEVPEPRGKPGSPRYVDDLRQEKTSARTTEEVSPSQEFKSRKVSPDAEWRRHQPSRIEDPDWESDEEQEEEYVPVAQRRHRMIVWSIFGVLGLFLLFASYQFILAQIGWMSPAMTAPDEPPLLQDPTDRWSRAEMLELARPGIVSFLGSTSNEQALQYVRRPGKVSFMMKKHYLPGSFQPMAFDSIGPAENCHLVSDGFFVIPVTLKDYSSRGIAVQIPDGVTSNEFLIDWESWEGYSEMGFSEMRLRQPKDPVLVRCYIVQDEYYNFEFSDKERYLSFKISDHTREEQLWVYADRSSVAYGKMVAALAGADGIGTGEEVATLRLRYLEGTSNPSSDQLEITELVTFGWVVRE
ncbi:MAG: hypothetical protein ACI8T1_003091 [Verrucomicrobiales bacterium]|jgi:hypothetical protein